MMTTTRTIAVGAMVALAAVPTDGACQTATSPGNSWSITLGTGWLALNGERRLVRDDRKVVTTDAESGVAPMLDVSFSLNDRYSLMFTATRLVSSYTHTETFTNGLGIATTDQLTLGMITGGLKRTWGAPGASRLEVDAHLAFLRYADRLELVSEQQLPADLSTITPTPFNLDVLDSFGGGLGVGVEVPLAGSGVFLSGHTR
jgi:hypothetical protein